MRVGIFFGGISREREVSFAGGRTVYDNMDKSVFEPVPIFVDSLGQFILLDWQFLYKGTIRDFYPSTNSNNLSKNAFQVYIESLSDLSASDYENLMNQVGVPLQLDDLPHLIDFAFLALHGALGEDGKIQGVLEYLQIPYSGSGIRASSLGMDKAFQKKLMTHSPFLSPEIAPIHRKDWIGGRVDLMNMVQKVGFPCVIRPANQGSSIGVSIIHESDKHLLSKSIDKAFFIERISIESWQNRSLDEKVHYLQQMTDVRSGIGFPCRDLDHNNLFFSPDELLVYLDGLSTTDKVVLQGFDNEHTVLLEEFIDGKEFSCVVIKNSDGTPIALPPTEIVKGDEVFDYRSKYLAGLSRKLTPIRIDDEKIENIRNECEQLCAYFAFNTYARIDGFIKEDGRIFLNDPNTTSGMLPSSFFFHQAAEIGLNPSQFITYIIRTSLVERIDTNTYHTHYNHLLKELDTAIQQSQNDEQTLKKIAVFMGGYSSERHISVESGRNIYEKLASSSQYDPYPIFVTGNDTYHELHRIPINLLLKDNADDIRDKLANYKQHPIIEKIQKQTQGIRTMFTKGDSLFPPYVITYDDLSTQFDAVFIALHGRPGEDGKVQQNLEKFKIPFNGSSASSAATTIDKYKTGQLLKQHGLPITEQKLVSKIDYIENTSGVLQDLAVSISYPFIMKPVDDGCSSAVKVIRNETECQAYFALIFELNPEHDLRKTLSLLEKEEFPTKDCVLVEQLIQKEDADHFLEITGGLLCSYDNKMQLTYEIFEPSETLTSGDILSLEEKFLAGEGQNITPARFNGALSDISYEHIAEQVKHTLKKAATILNVTGYARIDAFVKIYRDGRAETIIIEINSLPGMTPATCIFHQCALNGYKPFEFIHQIIEFGIERNQQLLRKGNLA